MKYFTLLLSVLFLNAFSVSASEETPPPAKPSSSNVSAGKDPVPKVPTKLTSYISGLKKPNANLYMKGISLDMAAVYQSLPEEQRKLLDAQRGPRVRQFLSFYKLYTSFPSGTIPEVKIQESKLGYNDKDGVPIGVLTRYIQIFGKITFKVKNNGGQEITVEPWMGADYIWRTLIDKNFKKKKKKSKSKPKPSTSSPKSSVGLNPSEFLEQHKASVDDYLNSVNEEEKARFEKATDAEKIFIIIFWEAGQKNKSGK